jgi:hypothetical protein
LGGGGGGATTVGFAVAECVAFGVGFGVGDGESVGLGLALGEIGAWLTAPPPVSVACEPIEQPTKVNAINTEPAIVPIRPRLLNSTTVLLCRPWPGATRYPKHLCVTAPEARR